MRDPRVLKDLHEEINRQRHELSRQQKALQSIDKEVAEREVRMGQVIAGLEEALREKWMSLKQFLDGIENEVSRMRRDRDHMRELYEQVNSQVIAANRLNGQLQELTNVLGCRVKLCEGQRARNDRFQKVLDSLASQSPDAQVKELGEMVKQLKRDEGVLFGEVDELGRAFEEVQGQHAGLLKLLAEREEASSKATGEKLRLEFAIVQVRKDADISMQKASILESMSLERIERADEREKDARRQVSDAESRAMQRAIESERMQRDISHLSSEVAEARAKVIQYQSRNADSAIADKVKALEESAFEKRRIAEDLEAAQRKLKAYMESSKGPQKDVEEELGIYKKLMKCNSCHIRDKSAVITKCMHVFCRQCLDTRIETRQRKCPNCAEPFGASDVRAIYL